MKHGRPRMSIEGRKFGRISVLRFTRVVGRNSRWLCKCHCGAEFETVGQYLRRRSVKSCGCNPPYKTHGHTTNGGMSLEYQSWRAMIQRCTNPKNNRFQYYGARGIRICKRWGKFKNFLRDMGKRPSRRHSIDRKNTNGNYTPSNCRWATPKVQRNNRRQ